VVSIQQASHASQRSHSPAPQEAKSGPLGFCEYPPTDSVESLRKVQSSCLTCQTAQKSGTSKPQQEIWQITHGSWST
jgi:hypothetical protein